MSVCKVDSFSEGVAAPTETATAAATITAPAAATASGSTRDPGTTTHAVQAADMTPADPGTPSGTKTKPTLPAALAPRTPAPSEGEGKRDTSSNVDIHGKENEASASTPEQGEHRASETEVGTPQDRPPTPETTATKTATTEISSATADAEETVKPAKAGPLNETGHSVASEVQGNDATAGSFNEPMLSPESPDVAASAPADVRSSPGGRAASPDKLVACPLRSLGPAGGRGRGRGFSLSASLSAVAAGISSITRSAEAELASAASITSSSSSEKAQRIRKCPTLPRVASLGSQRRVTRERASARANTNGCGGARGRPGHNGAAEQSSPSLRPRPAATRTREVGGGPPGLVAGPAYPGQMERSSSLIRPSAAASVRVAGAPSPGAVLADRKRLAEAKHAAGQPGKTAKQPASFASKGTASMSLK